MRWLRSLNAQLFLWAILPVTFLIIALSFTGVYAHERIMADFVAQRDLAYTQVIARAIEDSLGHGVVSLDGRGLAAWFAVLVGDHPGWVMVVERRGQVISSTDAAWAAANLSDNPLLMQAFAHDEGTVIATLDGTDLLVSFTAVPGADWVVTVLEPVTGLTGPLLRIPSLVPVVAASAGLLSLLVLSFGWHTIVRPLRQLGQAAGQVGWDNYSAISRAVGGVQEIRDLHRALSEMVERIRGYEAAMRDYAGAMTHGQETERTRLALELHDGPAQDLIVLGQRADMAQLLLKRGEIDRASEVLDELRRAEHKSVADLRRVIGALRPSYLADLGLVPALQMLVRDAAGRVDTTVRLEVGPHARRLAPATELAAYRIAQEALHNALQHAHAAEIVVRIAFTSDGIELGIRDNGVGYRLPQHPNMLTRAGHFGLLGMRERANLAGGTLEIHSAPGKGMEVIARLPGRSDGGREPAPPTPAEG